MSLIGPSATLRQCGPCGRIALLLLSGLVITTLDIGGASAQPAPPRRHEVRDPIAAHIAEAAQRFGIPERWIVAVLGAESAGDTHAVSHAGARGLMQVMPSTWDALRARYRLGLDPFDPRDNILAGAAYLREMFDRYGNVDAMLAAYNAGPDRYDEYLAIGRALPVETRAYVAALAPVLTGDQGPSPIIAAASTPPDWREAPLFVGRSISTSIADARPSGERLGDESASLPVRDMSAIEPQSGGLFVARVDTGEQQ